MNILVAEDNIMNQMIIRRMLKKLGYPCEFANNGIEAIEMTKQKNYDLILMDIQMPDMSGIEAATKIGEELGSKAPIIAALTANVREEEKLAYAKVGMTNVIPKPIEISLLQKLLNKIDVKVTDSVIDENIDLIDKEIQTQYLSTGEEEDRKFYYGVIVDFEKSYFVYKEKIDEYLEEGDYLSLKDIIHSFKGISYNIGAKKLGTFLSIIEDNCVKDPLAINEEVIIKVEDLFRKSIELLKDSAR